MSDLTNLERRTLERLLGMSSGYVLDFSNRTFEEFVFDSTGRDINDPIYAYGSGSKANRLRAFWNEEGNHVVAKLMADILDYGSLGKAFANQGPLLDTCRQALLRLSAGAVVPERDILSTIKSEGDFETLANEIREAIEKNKPENELDRLHLFVTKYTRSLCERHGIGVTRDKALQSIFGEYVKRLRERGHLKSEMTDRILKSTISVLDAFNHVRNDQSLAHDNPVLNYDEALLIFNQVTSLIRFLHGLEKRILDESK